MRTPLITEDKTLIIYVIKHLSMPLKLKQLRTKIVLTTSKNTLQTPLRKSSQLHQSSSEGSYTINLTEKWFLKKNG